MGATVEAARARGYDQARRIKVPHIGKEVTIPDIARLELTAGGNIVFQLPSGSHNFPDENGHTWTGVVYDHSTRSWAEITQYRDIEIGRYVKVLSAALGGDSKKYKKGDYLKILEKVSPACYKVEHAGLLDLTSRGRNRITIGDVELMPADFWPMANFPTLGTFPEEGVCWNPTQQLRDFLVKKYNTHMSNTTSKGVAWGTNNVWPVEESSGKPKYDITQLVPFLSVPPHVKDYPLTPEECYSINPGDEVIVDNPGDPSHGIKGIVDRVAIESSFKKLTVFFRQPLPRHPGGGNLVAVPYEKVRMVDREPISSSNSFPHHWALKVDHENIEVLQKFLENNNGDWSEYKKSWEVSIGCPPKYHNYFHYPPPGGPMHSDLKVQKGYTEITTEQFLSNYKQYKLNSEKNGKRESTTSEVVKVQRPNLSIRRDSTIREIGFRCPKSKIRIGTLDSEDQARFSSGETETI
jgi:hypothetical protein